MKSVFRALSVVFFLACLPAHGQGQMPGLLTRDLNLHSGPSATSERIASLKAEAKVLVLDPVAQNGYLHVRTTENQEGWVLAKGVKFHKVAIRVGAVPPISRKLVRPPASREFEPHKLGMAAAACQQDLASCPDSGCEPSGSPHGILNQIKRRIPSTSAASPVMLTFDDFNALQQQADNLVSEDTELSADDRAKLQGLTVAAGTVAEGDVVAALGYLVGVPHPNTGESVNCDLKGEANNDYHIPISNDPGNTDFQGIVVEMIPQNRPDNWNLTNLTQVENSQQLVMVTGALFYDNLHVVNADPGNPKRGQPHRFSLWEIHPITQFMVCTKSDNSCDPAQSGDWAPLGGGQ